MKILYLINYAGAGGSERYVELLMAHLKRLGVPCGLCFNERGALVDKAEAMGIPVHSLPMGNALDFRAAKALAKLCRTEGYTTVHAQYPRENNIAVLAKRFGSGAKVVFTSHLTIHQGLPWKIFNRIFTPGDKAVIAVCRESKDILKENGVKESRIRVIFNGIDAPASPVRDREALAPFGVGDACVFMTLSRFEPVKGLPFLVEAAARLKEISHMPFKLIIVGGGSEYDAVCSCIRELGLEDTIFCPGFRTDTAKLLQGADVYLNSSQSEALSFAILEGMAQGLPLVLTNVGGNFDLALEDGVCGFTAPYGDADAYAQAMKRLLESPELRKTFGKAALKKAQTVFAQKTQFDETVRTYE